MMMGWGCKVLVDLLTAGANDRRVLGARFARAMRRAMVSSAAARTAPTAPPSPACGGGAGGAPNRGGERGAPLLLAINCTRAEAPCAATSLRAAQFAHVRVLVEDATAQREGAEDGAEGPERGHVRDADSADAGDAATESCVVLAVVAACDESELAAIALLEALRKHADGKFITTSSPAPLQR